MRAATRSMAKRERRSSLAGEVSHPWDGRATCTSPRQQEQIGCCSSEDGCWSSIDALGAFMLLGHHAQLAVFASFAPAAFDPNHPATLYAALWRVRRLPGRACLRTTLAATTWTEITPPIDLLFMRCPRWKRVADRHRYRNGLRPASLGRRRRELEALDDIDFLGAPVFDLVSHNGELRAATFGCGVFSFVKPTAEATAVGLED